MAAGRDGGVCGPQKRQGGGGQADALHGHAAGSRGRKSPGPLRKSWARCPAGARPRQGHSHQAQERAAAGQVPGSLRGPLRAPDSGRALALVLVILKGSPEPCHLSTKAESAIFPFTWRGGGSFLKENYINRSTFIFLTCSKHFPILPCLLSSCYSRLCYCFQREFTGIDKEQDCFIKSFTQLQWETAILWENSAQLGGPPPSTHPGTRGPAMRGLVSGA